MRHARWLGVLAFLLAARCLAATPYWVRVVDAETGRGVPLVQLSTTNFLTYWTDSNGVAVVDDPALAGHDVLFKVHSDGYVFEQKFLGDPGKVLHVEADHHDELKLKSLNIAERLYRITGADIYRDTVLAGLKPPIAHPLLDGGVVGQDTNIATVYNGKIFWCWGDTNGLANFNYAVTCATSELPARGGLDPSVGVDLTYFTNPQGFARPMLPIHAPGLVWIGGLFTATDPSGKERLLASYTRVPGLAPPLECGIAEFDDATGHFRVIAKMPLSKGHISTHPFPVKVDGKAYWYLYPLERVPDDWKSILDSASYESYTCLVPGASLDMAHPQLERKAAGGLVCGWKRNTAWIGADDERKLIAQGLLDAAHANFPLIDVDTGKPTNARPDSVVWNAYRGKWILLSERVGTIFYSEADQPTGPWLKAKAVLTHAAYNFYNVVEHPFFDADNGRTIYFEGTYTSSFSGAKHDTPRYNYNQMMYRLDLADDRLKAARVK
jgi:hypothetical protein